MNQPPLPAPAITAEMREYARNRPGQRLYVMDDEFTDIDAGVPPWGVRGLFRITDEGEIDAEAFSSNPNYRPGPRVSGLPQPTNKLERAFELTATGYGAESDFLEALAEADLLCVVDPQDHSKLEIVADATGTATVVAFTSTDRRPEGVATISISLRSLAPALQNAQLSLNPGAAPTVTLPGNDLLQLIAT
ncbi:type VII secretion system-associated protein [Lentzea sp. NPDC051213]|uniref:type VII secretion system-associated protein n=1 Tax=Lentzea sp. NPDC051213 TaxID=3364126 RepID=UPI00378E0033